MHNHEEQLIDMFLIYCIILVEIDSDMFYVALKLLPHFSISKTMFRLVLARAWAQQLIAMIFFISAHGQGTAALSAKEPEALPFCAIAYALTGIFGSLLCSVPAVRQSLMWVAG